MNKLKKKSSVMKKLEKKSSVMKKRVEMN